MSKFMYIFRGGDAREVNQSPEQMQAHMQKWGVWMGALGESGNFIAGEPLQAAGHVVSTGGVVTDGPFAEGAEIVGGYLIVEATDAANATELSMGCPIFEYGGTVEVREVQQMNM